MTVLQMRGTDEETNQPPQKKRRLSRLQSEDTRQSVEAWVASVNNITSVDRFQMPAAPGLNNFFL